MTTHIDKRAILSPNEVRALRELADIAHAHDGYPSKIFWDCISKRAGDLEKDFLLYDNERLIGYLGAFEFKYQQFDITLLIHPDFRQQGHAHRLLAECLPLFEMQPTQRCLFACHRDAQPALAILAQWQAQQKHSEYTMALDDLQAQHFTTANLPIQLVPATVADLSAIAALDEICFDSVFHEIYTHQRETINDAHRQVWLVLHQGKAVGKMHVTHEHDCAFIHDFCIEPAMQGQGLGSEVLALTLKQLQQQGDCKAGLDVKCDNPSAIHIYTRQGFQTMAVYDFWLVQVTPEWLQKLQKNDGKR